MKDPLGDRMKSHYEDRAKIYLPRRTNTIIRIDGKAFHTYTKGLDRPYDADLMRDMDETAVFLCENIQGVKLAYVQSDEISLLLTDYDKITSDAWFNGSVQKIASVSASFATAKFNNLRPGKLAFFDSRVFTIPSMVEVKNYFVWRQQDAIRNSISSLAQYHFSPKQLHGKKTSDMLKMIESIGDSWEDYMFGFKYGRTYLRRVENNDGVTRMVWKFDFIDDFKKKSFEFSEHQMNNNKRVNLVLDDI